MGDPVTSLAIGSGAAGMVGTGVKMFGEWFSGEASSNQAKYQAAIARQNAALAKQDAVYATQVGEVEAQQSGMRTRAQVGRTRVGFGAGNIVGASGSAARVVSSETAIGQANVATIRASAAKRAYGFEVKAAQDTSQASVYDVAAVTSKEASYINMASTFVGGAANVSDKWLQASQYFPQGGAGVNPDSAQGQITYSNSIYT